MTTPPGPGHKTGIRAMRVAAADVARAAGSRRPLFPMC